MPPKKSLPRISTDFLSPDVNRMQTREDNKGRQVGKPDVKQKWAMKAEMLARREAESKAKEDDITTHLQAKQKVADIENAEEIAGREDEAHANHPPAIPIVRVPRPAIAPGPTQFSKPTSTVH
jgi:hypothetical protein